MFALLSEIWELLKDSLDLSALVLVRSIQGKPFPYFAKQQRSCFSNCLGLKTAGNLVTGFVQQTLPKPSWESSSARCSLKRVIKLPRIKNAWGSWISKEWDIGKKWGFFGGESVNLCPTIWMMSVTDFFNLNKLKPSYPPPLLGFQCSLGSPFALAKPLGALGLRVVEACSVEKMPLDCSWWSSFWLQGHLWWFFIV